MDCQPAVYEHAAFLIGYSPWDVSRDADLLFKAHAEAYRRYRHSPVVVSIDIYNLEAEAYGGKLARPHGVGIPAFTEPMCRSVAELAELESFDPNRSGRIPMTLEVGQRLASKFPEADVRVPMAGPISIASNLICFETLLLSMIDEPDRVGKALMHLASNQVRFCQAVNQAGLDVAFFESAATPPLISPDMFRHIDLPAIKRIMDECRKILGHPIPCVIGGDTEPILDAMLEAGSRYLICPIETNQAAFLRRVWDRTDVRIRVNASPSIMARGSQSELCAEVDRIIRLCSDRENVCLGTSALPYETPPENVKYVQALCQSSV